MRAFRWLGAALAIIVLAGAAWLGWQQMNGQASAGVRAVPLERTTLRATLRAVGNLSSQDELSLAAPLSSTILTLPVQLGETIEAGSPLVKFDPQDFDARRQALEAALRVVDQDVTSARREVTSLRPVVAAGGEPRKSLQDARSRLNSALARQAQADAELQAHLSLGSRHVLNAPVRGMITQLDARAGQYVTQGTPLMRLVPLDNLKIRARIDQSASESLRPGNTIEVTSESQPEVVLTLTIESIDPAIEREGNASYVVAWIAYDPESELTLRLNQQVDLKVVTQERQNAIAMRLEGLVSRAGQEQVRVLVDGRIRYIPVTTGIQDGGLIEIADGLTGNETVVVPIQGNVLDGAAAELISN
ncbi:MAG: efflux RND transporter periplasmic adaptor subunit [Burkholderiaceae bacterium]